MQKSFPVRWYALTVFPLLLLACTPTYNWREVRGTAVPFTVIMPASPSTYARKIDLDGMPVVMTMTAAEIGSDVFAVGAARVPKPEDAPAALAAMKIALVNNIHGTITREESSVAAPGASTTGVRSINIEASGPPSAATGDQPRLMAARFVAEGDRVYQVLVTGSAKTISRDAVNLFLTSFKPG